LGHVKYGPVYPHIISLLKSLWLTLKELNVERTGHGKGVEVG